MTEFPDPRVRFYLENEKLIDTWAALEGDTRVAISRWLLELRGDLDDLAHDLGVESSYFEDRTWKNHRLARSSWNAETERDLPVAVVLEWNEATIKLPTMAPIVGLRISGPTEIGEPRRTEFLSRFTESIKQTTEPYKIGNYRTWWPAQREIRPTAKLWWEHLDEYRDMLRSGLATAWNDLSPLVDEWLQDRPPL